MANTKSTKTWTDLLWGPLVMGMLCIFVGNVLHFFRKGDAAKLRRRLNIYFKVNLVDTHWRKRERKKSLPSTHLAVLMGLGSKLPCESTNVCFSSVPSRLASTKSGGRAPAMAHRHDLVFLKSSASYFYRGRQTQQEGGSETGFFILPPFSLQWGCVWLFVRWTRRAELSQGRKNGGWQHERQRAGEVCTKRWAVTSW